MIFGQHHQQFHTMMPKTHSGQQVHLYDAQLEYDALHVGILISMFETKRGGM